MVLQLNSELTQGIDNLKYYEIFSVELHEEINSINKNYICTFKNGKYADEIRMYVMKCCRAMLVLQDVDNF